MCNLLDVARMFCLKHLRNELSTTVELSTTPHIECQYDVHISIKLMNLRLVLQCHNQRCIFNNQYTRLKRGGGGTS